MSPVLLRQLRLQLSGQRHLALERGRYRLRVVMTLFLLGGLALFARLTMLTVINPAQAHAPHILHLPHLRADIIDRNGLTLATMRPTSALNVQKNLLPKGMSLIPELSAIFSDMTLDKLSRRLACKSICLVARNLSPGQVEKIASLHRPALMVVNDYWRYYPNNSLAAHVIGTITTDDRGRNTGVTGIEKYFDAQLATSATPQPVRLSIDTRVQFALEDELAQAVAHFQARSGFGIIMDVHSGAIRAMASVPDFDPNSSGTAGADQRLNQVTQGIYEFGSTFKTFTIAQALDAGLATPGTRHDATHKIHIGRFTIDDHDPQYRWMTTTDVFIHSSNIGAVRIAETIGIERQKAFFEQLGLLRRPVLELNELRRPLVPTPWNKASLMTASYGHGINISQLQLASAYATIVNGGTRVRPTLIEPGATVPPGARVLSPETSATMRAMLRLVVTQGTGSNADVPGYRVGGKTGTSDKLADDGSGYVKKNLVLSTFAGAFPMDAPRYVVIASLDRPHAPIATAAWVAAPIVKNVILRAAPALGVAKAMTDVDTTPLMPYVANPRRVTGKPT